MNSLHLCIDHNEMTSSICKGLKSEGLNVCNVRDLVDSSISIQFEDCVTEQLGKRLVKQPKIRFSSDGRVHNKYGKNPLDIKGLSEVGYEAWHVELRFSVRTGDNLAIQDISTEGFEQCTFVGNDYRWIHAGKTYTFFSHRAKELKTQTNHCIRICGGLKLPSSIFKEALKESFDKKQGSRKGIRRYMSRLCPSLRNYDFVYFRETVDHVATGKDFFCSCHKDVHNQILEELDFRPDKSSPNEDFYVFGDHVVGSGNFRYGVYEGLKAPRRYKDSICHLCLAEKHGPKYVKDVYGIHADYSPYVTVLMRRDGLDHKTAKKEVHRQLGISRWKREDQLYDLVQKLFKSATILREASPEWLYGLRFDIYLPEYNLAIEHQGQQHYEPVDCWGGEEGFKNTVRRDYLKRKRCKDNGVSLVEVRYDQALTEVSLRYRLNRWLKLKEDNEKT